MKKSDLNAEHESENLDSKEPTVKMSVVLNLFFTLKVIALERFIPFIISFATASTAEFFFYSEFNHSEGNFSSDKRVERVGVMEQWIQSKNLMDNAPKWLILTLKKRQSKQTSSQLRLKENYPIMSFMPGVLARGHPWFGVPFRRSERAVKMRPLLYPNHWITTTYLTITKEIDRGLPRGHMLLLTRVIIGSNFLHPQQICTVSKE